MVPVAACCAHRPAGCRHRSPAPGRSAGSRQGLPDRNDLRFARPKALRRYGRAGFALHAGYEAHGAPDRSELPSGLGVREGDWDRDAGLVEQLVTDQRGEPYGPDLAWLRAQGTHLLVRDGSGREDHAIALGRPGRVVALAGASQEAAVRVLWATIAEAQGEVSLGYLTNGQQWAISAALAARLSLTPGRHRLHPRDERPTHLVPAVGHVRLSQPVGSLRERAGIRDKRSASWSSLLSRDSYAS